MTTKAEVIYFPKPCPHCKDMLFRVEKMSAAWSECRNAKCPFIVNQAPMVKKIRDVEWTEDPHPYTECHNRR
jgi:NAD-dependent DNA ligase